MEKRAWTIGCGWCAPCAAGVIHGDFERGFIKAETISYTDLVECGSEDDVRKGGSYVLRGRSMLSRKGMLYSLDLMFDLIVVSVCLFVLLYYPLQASAPHQVRA